MAEPFRAPDTARLLRGARDEKKRCQREDRRRRPPFNEAKSRQDMQQALFQKQQVSRAKL